MTIQATIERPPAPPWVGQVPYPERVDAWAGQLIAWRWTDQPTGAWTGLVRYTREGLLYEHWVSGELLASIPDGHLGSGDLVLRGRSSA